MSAIKEFFKKKKTDAKFKLAGSGQKLGDNASSSGQSSRPTSSRAAAASSSSSNQGAKSNRGALSHEQRLAASAALQRYVNFFGRFKIGTRANFLKNVSGLAMPRVMLMTLRNVAPKQPYELKP